MVPIQRFRVSENGTIVALMAGNHTIESFSQYPGGRPQGDPRTYGYGTIFSGDCKPTDFLNTANLTIAPGEKKTCIITKIYPNLYRGESL